MNTQNTNATTFSDDALLLVEQGQEAKTGHFSLVKDHRRIIADLHDKLVFAQSQPKAKKVVGKVDPNSIRNVCLTYWASLSDNAAKWADNKKKLADRKDKTEKQKQDLAGLINNENKLRNMLERACWVHAGMNALENAGIDSKIEQGKGKDWRCAISREGEDTQYFDVDTLAKLPEMTEKFLRDTDFDGIYDAANKTETAAAPNEDKGGNGEKLAPDAIGPAITALDTTLAAYVKDNGALATKALYPAAATSLRLFWAMLNDTLSDADKAKGLEEYAKEKQDYVPEIVETVKQDIAKQEEAKQDKPARKPRKAKGKTSKKAA